MDAIPLKIRKAAISAVTMVDPTGVLPTMEIRMPISAHVTESNAEHIVTALKLLKRRIDDIAGKMISADISSDPTRFIARTIITAITAAINRL